MTASSQQYVSFLYERLYAKLTNDSFHDMWSIAGFVVVFLFCCLMLTLFMTVFFTSCCGRCFETPPGKVNRVAVAPARSSTRNLSGEGGSHVTVYNAPSAVAAAEPEGQKVEAGPPPPLPPPTKHVKHKKSKHKGKSPGKSQSTGKSQHNSTKKRKQ